MAFTAVISTLVVLPAMVLSRSELVQHKAFLQPKVGDDAFRKDLRNAFGEVLGCGGPHEKEQGTNIKEKLQSIWSTLPKSRSGRIERRLLHYLTNRYFMQAYSIKIRGFQPSGPMNQSHVGVANLLGQQVPMYLEAALESQRGFDIDDAVNMVATLEKLISDFEATLLEKVYQEHGKTTARALSRQGLEQVLQDYIVHWLLDHDQKALRYFLADRQKLWQKFPRWGALYGYAMGQIKAFDFQRQRAPRASRDSGSGALTWQYSFIDALGIVGRITRSFASFWNDECDSMNDKLVELDTRNTGRVPLSQFYSKKLSQEWRFAESEEYLRKLGALDETSIWHGTEVIIPNYIHSASNCMIATPHYFVCCMDPCDRIFSEIEVGIGAPVALPGPILTLVGNMSSQTSLDNEDLPQLKGSLTEQLDKIASTHGGKVPLHGRLFAQWLHYAFPRECPFPHRSGTASMVAPGEYGEYLVKETDRIKHSSNASSVPMDLDKEEMQWMSQWSSEEELLSDYAADLRAPWEVAWSTVAIILFVVTSITGIIGLGPKTAGSNAHLPTHSQTHSL